MQERSKSNYRWSSTKNFVMALICWTVGLGNCWRFPVAASLDGGGAFLIPYLLEMVLVAIPFCHIELGLGQFSNKGHVEIWKMCPIWKGVGYGNTFVIVTLMVYYNIICSYLLFFFFASLSSTLPWASCDPEWASINCFTFEDNVSIRLNCTQKYGEEYCNQLDWQSSALHYWHVRVLNVLPSAKPGYVQWNLVYCSLITLLLVFLINCKGTKSIEKAVTFLCIFPYLELLILLFVSLIHPGGSRGMKAFMTPDFQKLWSSAPWTIAFQQIIFSTGIGIGGLVMLGSQSHFRSPVHLEAIALNLIDFASSMCYGLMIFNCLGALSYDLNLPVEEIMQWHDTLLFAKIPLCLMYLPGVTSFWAALFYSSIYIIGLRSEALMMTTVLNIIYDSHPSSFDKQVLCSALACLTILILGYPFYTQIGSIILNFIDNITVGPCLIMVCFFEAVGVMCFYGVTQFTDDMHFMLGFRASAYWQTMWIFAPVLFALALIESIFAFLKDPDNDSVWAWIQIMQWIILFVPFALLVLGVILFCLKRERIKCDKLFIPSNTWGPIDPILKKSRGMFTAHSMTKEYMYRQNRLKTKIKIQEEDGQD